MRGIVFLGFMAALLPMALFRPFVGVLLWCWVSFMSPHRQMWGAVAEIPWAAIIFAVTTVGLLTSFKPGRVRPNALTWLFLALAGCFTLTSFVALGPANEVWAKWEEVLKILLGLILTASLLSNRERIHALMWVVTISFGWYGVKGGIFTLLNGGAYRVNGPDATIIADNNQLAVALLVTVPIMNYLRLQSRHAVVRWGLGMTMILTTAAALGSHSRGALLALAAGALVLWMRSRRKIIMGGVVAACVLGGIAFMPAQWTARMDTIATYEEDASAMDRLKLWRSAFDLAVLRPLVGVGFRGTYQRNVMDLVAPETDARAIHSIWFELLAEHGFPIFALWIGILLLSTWYAWQLPCMTAGRPDLAWARDLGLMVQVSIVAYVVGGSFLSLSYWDGIWTILVAVAASRTLVTAALAAERKPLNVSRRLNELPPVPLRGHAARGEMRVAPTSVS